MDASAYDISTAKDLLRTMLANTTAFRTWDGANYTVEQAKARIYFDALPPPADGDQYTVAELAALRNCAIVAKHPSENVRWVFDACGGDHFNCHGVLVVMLFRTIPEADRDDIESAERSMENFVGQLVRSGDPSAPGLCELSGRAGYLSFYEIMEDGPHFDPAEDGEARGHEMRHLLVIRWGVRV